MESFPNYDNWLERPYQDACARADREDYLREHATYTTDCCGQDVDYESVNEDGPTPTGLCRACHERSTLNVEFPDLDGDDGAEYGGDGRDD